MVFNVLVVVAYRKPFSGPMEISRLIDPGFEIWWILLNI
jgi:hypothetical protein